MEDYLRSIKHIADSLASIWTPIPDNDLVQLTLNGLDEDYHNLVTMLSYGTNLITFDDLRSKLNYYGQWLKFLKYKELLGIQHQALATSVASSESGKSTSSSQSTHRNGYNGDNKGKGRNNNRKRNRNQGAEMATLISFSRSLQIGMCLQELLMA